VHDALLPPPANSVFTPTWALGPDLRGVATQLGKRVSGQVRTRTRARSIDHLRDDMRRCGRSMLCSAQPDTLRGMRRTPLSRSHKDRLSQSLIAVLLARARGEVAVEGVPVDPEALGDLSDADRTRRQHRPARGAAFHR